MVGAPTGETGRARTTRRAPKILALTGPRLGLEQRLSATPYSTGSILSAICHSLPQPDLDRLMALQRFWGRFYDLYRYEVVMDREMPLTEPHPAAEKGGNA